MRADHRHALARLKPVVPDTDLRARVRDVLAHRALLVSAIAEIDNELQAVFEAVAADHPVAVPPAPQSPVVLAPALRAAETRTRRARRAQEIRSESNASPKWPRGASVDADVCRAIAWGLDTPRQLWARLDWGQSAIRAALRRLVETGQDRRPWRHLASALRAPAIPATADRPGRRPRTRGGLDASSRRAFPDRCARHEERMSPLPSSSPLYGRRDWISTYSGLPFFPLAPRPEDVRIADIAHALARLCRFAGQCREFYSVAQHSVLVSGFCPPEDALWGLLHDASEAYLCDITSPVKRSPALDGYRLIERQVQAAIATRFGLPQGEPPAVKDADQVLLRTEQRDLLPMPAGWYPDRVAFTHRLVPLSAEAAEQRFLERFEELTGGAR